MSASPLSAPACAFACSVCRTPAASADDGGGASGRGLPRLAHQSGASVGVAERRRDLVPDVGDDVDEQGEDVLRHQAAGPTAVGCRHGRRLEQRLVDDVGIALLVRVRPRAQRIQGLADVDAVAGDGERDQRRRC